MGLIPEFRVSPHPRAPTMQTTAWRPEAYILSEYDRWPTEPALARGLDGEFDSVDGEIIAWFTCGIAHPAGRYRPIHGYWRPSPAPSFPLCFLVRDRMKVYHSSAGPLVGRLAENRIPHIGKPQ
jgi:hypothetical protein